MTHEKLAFLAGWQARDGYKCKELPGKEHFREADWLDYKRETAEPERCGCCGRMIVQGAVCGVCSKSD